MANYSVEANISPSSTTLAVGGLLEDATTQRRCKMFDIVVGSEATPADTAILWVVDRGTTALGTSSAVTPSPLDPADAISLTDAGENFTVNPTIGVRLLSIPVNQRATFRWVAFPGSELVLAATANLSLLIRTTVNPSVPACTTTFIYQEQ